MMPKKFYFVGQGVQICSFCGFSTNVSIGSVKQFEQRLATLGCRHCGMIARNLWSVGQC